METLIIALILSLGGNLLSFGVFGLYKIQKVRDYGLREYIRHLLLSFDVSFFSTYAVAVLLQMVSSDPNSVFTRFGFFFPFITLPCCIYAISVYMENGAGKSKDKTSIYSLMKSCCIGTAVVLFAEIFVFNYISFVPTVFKMKSMELSPSQAHVEGSASLTDAGISLGSSGGIVTFDNVNLTSGCFRIYATDNQKVNHVSIDLKDENMASTFYNSGNYLFSPRTPRASVVPVFSSGKMSSVKFTFDANCTGMIIQKITMNQPDIFLSVYRFSGLLILVLTVIVIRKKRWYTVLYNSQSSRHSTVILIMATVLCMISVILGKMSFQSPENSKEIAYPLTGTVDSYSCYVQQFDAFQKGQLNLDVSVDPKLTALENPYDVTQRNVNLVGYSWDRSFFDGKYYSYFGLTPLIVYYPYFLIRHALPTDATVAAIFSVMAVAMIVLLVWQVAQMVCKKINFLLLLLGMVTAVFANLIYAVQVSADFYHIPYLSALVFLCLFFFLALRAYTAVRLRSQVILLAFSGLSYVLAVASRPVAALYILVLVPTFIMMFFRKEKQMKTRLIKILSFAVPVMLGAVLLMAYNYARFRSPFEFGQDYQLTIDNMKWNKPNIFNFLPALYYYFFQLPTIDPQFPFIHICLGTFQYSVGFKLHTLIIGVMGFPFLWSLFALRNTRFYQAEKRNKVTCLLALLCTVVIAFADYSTSGTAFRYIEDILPVLSVMAIMILLDFNSRSADSETGDLHRLRKWMYSFATTVLCLSILIGAAAIFGNERNNIQAFAPSLYTDVARLCMFW